MEMFNLLIISPSATLYEGVVLSAILPGADGQFEVLAGHAPIIALLKKGIINIVDEEKKKKSFPIDGGFFEFYGDHGTVTI